MSRNAQVTVDEVAIPAADEVETKGALEVLQFPLAVAITLFTSAGLFTLGADYTGNELASVSKVLTESHEIFGLLAWRIAVLFILWTLKFDWRDVLSTTFLSTIPYYTLLYLFYSLTPQALVLGLLIDITSQTLPFILLRRSSPAHLSSLPLSSSPSINILITLLAATVYSATLYISLQTFLPLRIISNFATIRTLEPAHTLSFSAIIAAALPLGLAARSYLYVPSIAASHEEDAAVVVKTFDHKTATFTETIVYGITNHPVYKGIYSRRGQVLCKRMIVLGLLTLGNGIAKIWGTISGAELRGSIEWTVIWIIAGQAVGALVGWVGDA